jgi:hypothetical protein
LARCHCKEGSSPTKQSPAPLAHRNDSSPPQFFKDVNVSQRGGDPVVLEK